jgi:hypothetical protein
MKKLLENDYISHYNLSGKYTVNITTTKANCFVLDDRAQLNINGDAKYDNPNGIEVNAICYESFF